MIPSLRSHGCVTSLTFSLKVPAPKPQGYPATLNTLADHIKVARFDRELLQKDIADILGVSCDTIENWEANRHTVNLMHIPAVTKFLGYCLIEHHPEGGWKQTLLNYRKQQGMSMIKFSKMLKIDDRSLSKIERGEKISEATEIRIRKRFLPTLEDPLH